jgi:hypothetical protein
MRSLWVSLALVLGCAPTGPPELVDDAARGSTASDAPIGSTVATPCGGLPIAGFGEWRVDDPVLDALEDAWDPRGPEGQPVAIRSASTRLELPGHTFFEVSVRGGPREVIGCWVGSPPEQLDPCPESESVLMMLRERPDDDRPASARAWVELLGTTEGASAVFGSEAELDRCVPGLPADVRARVPRLGLGSDLTFVERLDPTPELTMLVLVRAHVDGDSPIIEREELLTTDRAGAR